MNKALFAFHKQAEIHVITGRMGAGKSTAAEKLSDKYDLVVPTDFSRPKLPSGKYTKVSRAEKTKIRVEKLEQILKADAEGKKVLVEGHPPGVVKLFRDELKSIDKVKVLDISLLESFRRTLQRAVEDPDERDVMEEMDSAVDNNKKYDRYLKQITDAGVPVETFKTMTKEAAKVMADQKTLDKIDQHLAPSETSRWQGFGKNLRSKTFMQAFKQDERATPSQKLSAEMRHKHLTSKVKGVKVRGETGTYTVKYHPDVDRYTCSCGDFTYKKSGTAKGVCKHIDQARVVSQEQVPLPLQKVAERVLEYEKQAGLIGGLTARGLQMRQAESARRSGMVAKSVADAYEQNMPGGHNNLRLLPFRGKHHIRDIIHEALPNIQY